MKFDIVQTLMMYIITLLLSLGMLKSLLPPGPITWV